MQNKPTVVFLDAATVSHKDSFRQLKKHCNLQLFPSTEPQQVVERIHNASVVLTNKVAITASMVSKAPKLRLIQVVATGTNIIAFDCESYNIKVLNVPAYSSSATSQHAIALLLALTNGIGVWAQTGAHTWSKSSMFWDPRFIPTELQGKKLGIIGYGAIGKKVASIAQALGMSVAALARNHSPSSEIPRLRHRAFFTTSDVISLHCPLTPETKHIINKETLELMPTHSVLINTSRGGLVDGDALYDALIHGSIAGAGLDVLEQEPPAIDNPLLQPLPNLLITPHIAWAARESQERLVSRAVHNIIAFLNKVETL